MARSESRFPIFLVPHTAHSSYVVPVEGNTYGVLMQEVRENEALYALYDVPKTPDEIAAERRQVEEMLAAGADPDDMFVNGPIALVVTHLRLVRDEQDFLSSSAVEWSVSGVLRFYRVPDWLASEAKLV